MALYHAAFIFLKGVNFAGHLGYSVFFYQKSARQIVRDGMYQHWPAHEYPQSTPWSGQKMMMINNTLHSTSYSVFSFSGLFVIITCLA